MKPASATAQPLGHSDANAVVPSAVLSAARTIGRQE
jgi:hypothetical protein